MISKEEFLKKCKQIVPQSEVNAINKQRKNRNRTMIIAPFVIIAICMFLGYFVRFEFYFAPIIAIPLILGIIKEGFKKSYAGFGVDFNSTKKKYAKEILACLLNGYKYNYLPSQHIPEDIYKSSPLYQPYSIYNGEDYLSINIPNSNGSPSTTYLNVSDIELIFNSEEGSNHHNHTYSGSHHDSTTHTPSHMNIPLSIGIGKNSVPIIKTYSGAFGYIKFPNKFKCSLGLNVSSQGLQNIKVEDVAFNNKFLIYTDNHLEALVILTPTLIRKLMSFSKIAPDFKLFISQDGTMYFSMSRNLFEVQLNNVSSHESLFEPFYNDIHCLLSIINEIQTNNKIFKI